MSYSSIDKIFASIDQLFLFLCVACSLLGVILVNLLIVFIFFNIRKKTPLIFVKILRLFLGITSEVLFIPTTIILILFIKYSYTTKTIINEYPDIRSSNELNYGPIGQTIALVLLFCHLSLTILYKGCKYEIRYSQADKNIAAKSVPYVDIVCVMVYFFNSISFASIRIDYY